MMKLFNSTFEVSLRALLLLSVTSDKNMTVDRIISYDFFVIYSQCFGLSDINLHGDNNYGFCELSAHRKSFSEALKILVLDGLAKAIQCSNGFCYTITETGWAFCRTQKTEYANTYRRLAKAACQVYDDFSEVELLAVINQRSAEALRR